MRPDLDRLAARLPARPRTRFAPSPTGYLHLGHVVDAIYVWGLASALGGSVLLRIEDHDRERSRPEFEDAIHEDLAWLGLRAGGAGMEVPPAGADGVRQSDRESVYADALERLRAYGRLYACACSRREIAALGAGPGGEPRYPGTCRHRGPPLAPGYGVRVRLDARAEAFEDGLLGPEVQIPAEQCGDLLVRDRRGGWTYQFAVTVDDMTQAIDLVIRGRDLLASTGRQIQLARLLGRTAPPVFVHHPLVLAPSGVKLSKANRDAGVRELRAAAVAPGEVLGLAAAAVGLVETPRAIDSSDLGRLFCDPERPEDP